MPAPSLDQKATVPTTRPIAIVGSGIGGLAAAYILSRNGRRAVLFEKNDYCGGHTLTDTTANPPVDLGYVFSVHPNIDRSRFSPHRFMVFNYKNYPHLTGFFDQLQVERCGDVSTGCSL